MLHKRHVAVALFLTIVARESQSTSSSQHQAPAANPPGPGLPVEVSQLKRKKRRRKTAAASCNGQAVRGGIGLKGLDDIPEMFGDAPKRKRRKRRRGITSTSAKQSTGGTQEMLVPIDFSIGQGPEDLGDEFDETGESVQLDSPITDIEASPDDSTSSAPLKVDRDESSETISYIDEKTGEQYEKTIRQKEETIEDSSIDGFAVKADVITSEIHETVQDVESSTTIKVSKKQRHQRVRVSRSSSTAPGSSRRTQSVSTRDNECLRRIKREWREAVKMGVAFDWTTGHTINEQVTSDRNYVRIGPLGKNLLRWHFSCQGPANSVYQTGLYHGQVLLPRDYPGSPPRVQMLTPSGRFLCGHDICLSASNYHPESWTPRWTVLSLVDALRLHMLTTANEIGGVSASDEKRREYAESSRTWKLPGVVDHGRMISEGIFPLLNADREGDDAMNDDGMSDGERGNVPSEEDVAKVERQPSQGGTGADHSSAKQIKSKSSKQSKHSTEDASILATQTNEGQGLIPLLLKRTLIESLKLPLRILSLILMSLTVLESRLRHILDNI